MLIVSLGITYTPYIYDVAIMYASVSMISLVGIPIEKHYCKANHFSKYFPRNFSSCCDAPLVLHRSILQYQEEYIKGLPYSVFWHPKISKELIIA